MKEWEKRKKSLEIKIEEGHIISETDIDDVLAFIKKDKRNHEWTQKFIMTKKVLNLLLSKVVYESLSPFDRTSYFTKTIQLDTLDIVPDDWIVDKWIHEVNESVIIIKGQAGSGKTTFLKNIAWTMMEYTNYYPCYVNASEIGAKSFEELKRYFETKYLIDCNFIKSKRIVYMIDGLDEVQNDSLVSIKDMIKNIIIGEKIIITMRTPSKLENELFIKEIRTIMLCEMNDSEIFRYFKFKYLVNNDNFKFPTISTGIIKYARTPLMADILYEVFKNSCSDYFNIITILDLYRNNLINNYIESTHQHLSLEQINASYRRFFQIISMGTMLNGWKITDFNSCHRYADNKNLSKEFKRIYNNQSGLRRLFIDETLYKKKKILRFKSEYIRKFNLSHELMHLLFTLDKREKYIDFDNICYIFYKNETADSIEMLYEVFKDNLFHNKSKTIDKLSQIFAYLISINRENFRFKYIERLLNDFIESTSKSELSTYGTDYLYCLDNTNIRNDIFNMKLRYTRLLYPQVLNKKMASLDFKNCHVYNGYSKSMKMVNCLLSESVISNCNFELTVFKNTTFKRNSFYKVYFKQTVFDDITMENSYFLECCFDKCKFINSSSLHSNLFKSCEFIDVLFLPFKNYTDLIFSLFIKLNIGRKSCLFKNIKFIG